ncbi:MAG: His Kinase (phospho-acceptor) protein [Mucilaginibacter sp.]|nr:His Kinase (phospho-acceptor) protein [Mucilaginibacter sp.]
MKNVLNRTITALKLLKKKKALVLLLLMAMASAAIIMVNYYSIKILSGAGAYINGESEYSKGQKDASAHLINYISFENESDYAAFEKAISIPKGDNRAQRALSLNNSNYELAKKGFLQGKNHPEDIDDMIWLFNRFRRLAMFEKAITIWQDGDAMISDLDRQGIAAHKKIIAGKIPAEEKRAMILAINSNSAGLTLKEQAFSAALGDISRKINRYVFIVNVLITLVIVFSSLSSAAIMISNLAKSKKRIMEQNENLQVINAGLDKFVFNVTHDLRSPLASLVGLIDLIDDETDLGQIKEYILMMKGSLEKQDRFINEMLTFIKSKHMGVNKTECSLITIVDDVISQNNYYNGGKEIMFYKELELTQIQSDALKLQVILNNLVSNSVKYSDWKKPEQWVKVKSYRSDTQMIIEVEDNGLGIRQKDQERIFDKFYMSGDNKRSSGIGLYLVKDAVTQLNGKIEVRSEPGVSSRFKVSIPFS